MKYIDSTVLFIRSVLLPKLICDMNNKKKSQKYPQKKKSWETNLVSL